MICSHRCSPAVVLAIVTLAACSQRDAPVSPAAGRDTDAAAPSAVATTVPAATADPRSVGSNPFVSFEAMASSYVGTLRELLSDRIVSGGIVEISGFGHSVRAIGPSGQKTYQATLGLTYDWTAEFDALLQVEVKDTVTFVVDAGKWAYDRHRTRRTLTREGRMLPEASWPESVKRVGIGAEVYREALQALDPG